MTKRKNKGLLCFLLLSGLFSAAQDTSFLLTKDNFLGIVRSYHPVVKQAALQVDRARAAFLQSKGQFDPALQAAADRKSFDGKLYYSYINPQLTVPLWYGVDLKAGLEEVGGARVSPEATPGKTSYLGIKVPASGLLFDQRRAVISQARRLQQLSEAERLLAVNDVLYEGLAAYWNWVKECQGYKVVSDAVRVNEERIRFVRTEFEQGARPAIDTTEALSQLQQFYAQQNDAWLSFQNAGLELSNYLWLPEEQPLPWNPAIMPAAQELEVLQPAPMLDELLAQAKNHPKLQGLVYKIGVQETEQRIKKQSLLPKLAFNANLLGAGYRLPEKISVPLLEKNYKIGLDVSLPLFFREARGAYQAAKIKVRETVLEQKQQGLQVENKVKTYYNEVLQLHKQVALFTSMQQNHARLLQGERIRFEAGESSLFLLNSRENKVLETGQKLIELKAKWHKSMAGLLWAAGQLR